MYAPSRPNSPLTDRHDPSADDSHSPHPLPTTDANAPLTSSPLPNPSVDGCPPRAPSLYQSLAHVDVPLRFFIFFLIYMVAHLTRLTQQTLALTCDSLTLDPSALVLPPLFSTPHALPNSPVAAIMPVLSLLRLVRPTCSTRMINRSLAPPAYLLAPKILPLT
jgi:hypothetical protein